MTTRKNRKYRIAHYPQIPCKPFIVQVDNLRQAHLMYNTLANYDLFLLAHNIRPDFNNAIDVQVYDADEKEWVTWYDDLTGIGDINEYMELYGDNVDSEEYEDDVEVVYACKACGDSISDIYDEHIVCDKCESLCCNDDCLDEHTCD